MCSKFYKVSKVGSIHESVDSFLLPRGLSIPVNSCNGLLAFPKYEWTKHKLSVHIWNPLTRKRTRHPPNRDLHVCGWITYHRDFSNFRTCGLGYDSILNEYKIIAFLGSETVVCTIGSTSWRHVKEVPFVPLKKKFSIYLNGTLYWFASAQKIEGIGSFGIGNEKFGFVAFPTEVIGKFGFELSVLGGCLCLIEYESRENVIVWALKKRCDGGGEEVWIKQFVLSMPNNCRQLSILYAFNNGEILLMSKVYDETRWIVKCVYYDPKNNRYRDDQTFISSFPSEPKVSAIVHVGSLVSLSQR
ncbi:hypothetical protein FRX31_021026 [Thalictrum thalictroides]|uniref:F-box associated beta-propeller type 3 domain-containing protein n=1 Tax=Thalictrum thalictroides TaxID=46969 RepID=A0A7J6VXI2_THATH|nr:hypothetical protein FRX31_021026 [Thalictrum thalictroides]